jgi:hypothetical protein
MQADRREKTVQPQCVYYLGDIEKQYRRKEIPGIRIADDLRQPGNIGLAQHDGQCGHGKQDLKRYLEKFAL